MDDLRAELGRLPSLSDLPAADRDFLLESAQAVRVAAGERLFAEGEAAEGFYLILSGQVAIAKHLEAHGARSMVLATLQPGDPVGEMGVIEGLPRGADAHALDEVRALRVPAEAWQRLMDESPARAASLMRLLLRVSSQRLRATDLELVTLFEVGRIVLERRELPAMLREVLNSLLFFCGADAGLAFLRNPFSGALEAFQGAGREAFTLHFAPQAFGDPQRFDVHWRLHAVLEDGVARVLLGGEADTFMDASFGYAARPIRWLVLAPLREPHGSTGLLALARLEGDEPLPRGVLTLLDAVTAQVAQAVELARMRAAEHARERFQQIVGGT